MPQLKAKLGEEWITVGGPGVGVPAGGAAGQILVKASASDFATAWTDPPNPTPTLPFAGTVRAWALVTAAGTVAAQAGFSSVTRPTTGTYTLTFAVTPATPYAAVASINGSVQGHLAVQQSGASVNVWIHNASLDAMNADFTIIVAGGA